jgi:nitroreductase
MELYEAMRTTFAAREFTDEQISDVTLYKILDNARFAPSGGNRQGWKVIVVRNSETREGLAQIMRPSMQRYIAQVKAGESPFNTIVPSQVSETDVAATEVPQPMVDNLTNAPVILLVFVDLARVASFDSALDRVGVISGASIYPFVWNILLAARAEGLGGTLTTFAGGQEQKLIELVGAPEGMAFAAMIPMGKPVKQLTKLKRADVDTFAVLEHWSGEKIVG